MLALPNERIQPCPSLPPSLWAAPETCPVLSARWAERAPFVLSPHCLRPSIRRDGDRVVEAGLCRDQAQIDRCLRTVGPEVGRDAGTERGPPVTTSMTLSDRSASTVLKCCWQTDLGDATDEWCTPQSVAASRTSTSHLHRCISTPSRRRMTRKSCDLRSATGERSPASMPCCVARIVGEV